MLHDVYCRNHRRYSDFKLFISLIYNARFFIVHSRAMIEINNWLKDNQVYRSNIVRNKFRIIHIFFIYTVQVLMSLVHSIEAEAWIVESSSTWQDHHRSSVDRYICSSTTAKLYAPYDIFDVSWILLWWGLMGNKFYWYKICLQRLVTCSLAAHN